MRGLRFSFPASSGGAQRDPAPRDVPPRFIPALAGNIPFAMISDHPISVHPRVRGEHLNSDSITDSLHGSSPRSRGTLVSLICVSHCVRFIPAFAGNIGEDSPGDNRLAVHPRVRGEHITYGWLDRDGNGSSPRSRGTCIARVHDRTISRFIPAFAGNILIPPPTSSVTAVHPRVRGEHITHPPSRIRYCRFIPAFAGNIHDNASIVSPVAVHPRVRGEHITKESA